MVPSGQAPNQLLVEQASIEAQQPLWVERYLPQRSRLAQAYARLNPPEFSTGLPSMFRSATYPANLQSGALNGSRCPCRHQPWIGSTGPQIVWSLGTAARSCPGKPSPWSSGSCLQQCKGVVEQTAPTGSRGQSWGTSGTRSDPKPTALWRCQLMSSPPTTVEYLDCRCIYRSIRL